MVFVQKILEAGIQRLVADGGIKTNACTDEEIPLLPVRLRDSNVHLLYVCRGQDLFHGFFGVFGKPKASGKVIAGAGGDIAQGNVGVHGFHKPVHHLIHGAVTAHNNQGAGYGKGSDLVCQLSSMSLLLGKIGLIFQIFLIQTFFYTVPDLLSFAGTGAGIDDKIVHILLLLCHYCSSFPL